MDTLCDNLKSKKIMVQARQIINNDVKARYSWRQAHSLYFGGTAGYSVLWAAPIQRNHHWGMLQRTTDAIELSIEAKTARLVYKTRLMVFPARQRSSSCHDTAPGNVS
ncbi:hypothetical protein AVEN_152968-1 [Araneus ventricosus]|uniref:Uncharacterized protein n=1 Tax=Araneus ventricosus TaxID=182803 RepID=A0A4Y2AEU9_ARAVE|nr:hypothetical protein AVEN_152968-1 [Araneus ventricosus]